MKRVLTAGILLLLVLPTTTTRAQTTDFAAVAQRALLWAQEAIQWGENLQILRDAADVRDAIRDAAEETQGIVEDHREMYDKALQGVGFLLDEDPRRRRLRRFGDVLDDPAADQGLTFRRPGAIQERFVMGDMQGMSAADYSTYQQSMNMDMAATVANTLGTLSEYYTEMEDLDEQLQMLEKEFASARTPEARRDIQINLQILQARHQLLGGLVETAEINMSGLTFLQMQDQQAAALAGQQKGIRDVRRAVEAYGY